MLFNSIDYLIFFPIVVGLYFILPQRTRWVWLLLASYYFYMSWSPKYAVLIMTSTIITYLSGILIERAHKIQDEEAQRKQKNIWVALSFVLNLAILFFFKYFNFLNENLEAMSNALGIGYGIPNFDVLLPVGISFYTFQALSYTMDVYRGDIKAEHHFGRYALFVSFFPQLVAGPIEKSSNLLPQLTRINKIDYERMKSGLLLILWGLFKKVVIADRLAVVVNTVYNAPTDHTGITLIVATIFFAFQIYCDFSSYSDIAIGSAKVMGYDLVKNFDRPYFSQSIGEFWRRWHISLGAWFRDYLYFPLGGNRVKKILHYRNIMVVFLVSGLWHGASWNFVIWGGLHGGYQVVSMLTKSWRDRFFEITGLERGTFGHRLSNITVTFILVCIAWIFFRANTTSDAFYIVSHLFVFSGEPLSMNMFYNLGLEKADFILSIFLLWLLLTIQCLQEKGSVRDMLNMQPLLLRWPTYAMLIFATIIFGVYGDYDAAQFIYFQF